MKRIISVMAVMALMVAMVAVAALPAFAVGQNPPTSCGLGNAVSDSTQKTKEFGFGGQGKAVHTLGFDNVGNEVLQPFRAEVVTDTCQA